MCAYMALKGTKNKAQEQLKCKREYNIEEAHTEFKSQQTNESAIKSQSMRVYFQEGRQGPKRDREKKREMNRVETKEN